MTRRSPGTLEEQGLPRALDALVPLACGTRWPMLLLVALAMMGRHDVLARRAYVVLCGVGLAHRGTVPLHGRIP